MITETYGQNQNHFSRSKGKRQEEDKEGEGRGNYCKFKAIEVGESALSGGDVWLWWPPQLVSEW